MRRFRVPTLLAAVVLAGCAGASAPLAAPPAAEIPDLEAAVAADPDDPGAVLLLAAAYRAADRGERALAVVQDARARLPDDAGLLVMEGVLLEDAEAWGGARELYERYLAGAPRGDLAGEVRRRLAAVRREELRADVRRALAQEAALAAATPDPATVGVFPFSYEGDDPQWEPLTRALAELLVTDLAITGRLRVVERVKVQALLDELRLSASGLVEPGTAVRSGHLLGSGRVVQGRFRVAADDRVAVDAAVVPVGAGDALPRPVQHADALERLFELEKRLALDLHAELGIELTPAERVRVDERHTESLQALLAFGRGLEALDGGAYEEAETYFAEAASIDPAFTLATARRAMARAAAETRLARSRIQAQAMRAITRRQAVDALRSGNAAARRAVLQRLTDRQRAVLAEVLGQDRIGTTVLLELVFRRPGGGP